MTNKAIYITAALTAVSVALMIGGFFCPPMGAIDNSVLKAAGILFAFAALWAVIIGILRGADVKITHGKTNVEINNE